MKLITIQDTSLLVLDTNDIDKGYEEVFKPHVVVHKELGGYKVIKSSSPIREVIAIDYLNNYKDEN